MSTSDCPFTESAASSPVAGLRRYRAGWLLLVLTLAAGWGCTKPSLSPTEGYNSMARGIGLLEQYDYAGAYKLFSSLCESFPGWEAAWVNRGIAGLNLQDESKCIPNMKKVLELNPANPHALLVLGIQYKHIRRMDEALDSFRKVIAQDPDDPHGHYYVGEILAEREDREGAVSHLRRALQLQPSFASAWYRLANLHRRQDKELRTGMLDEFKRLKSAGAGILVGSKYGEGGRYSLAVRDSLPPGYSAPPSPGNQGPGIGPAREISGLGELAPAPAGAPAAGMALGDLDGDGSLELVLCGSLPPGGTGESSLAVFNYSAAGGYTPGRRLPFDAQLCCLADLDGDTDLDLVAASAGSFRFLVNDGKGGLQETSPALKLERDGGFPLRLYALDLDSDWDLDILCLRQWKAADGKISSRVQVLNNDRSDPGGFGGFSEITTACGLKDFDLALLELAVVDLDGDVDLDLAVFDGQGAARIFSNHRAWKFSEVEQAGKLSVPGIVSVTSGDLDGDGDEDLVAFCGDSLRLLRNDGLLRFTPDEDFNGRFGSLGGTGGAVFDFDGNMVPELLVADARSPGESTGAALVSSGEKPARYALRSEAWSGPVSVLAGCMGIDGGVELVVADPAGSATAHALDIPGTWIAIELSGPLREAVKPDAERSNPAALGASIEVRSGTGVARRQLNSSTGGTARTAARFFCGLGGAPVADTVRILWPDGILQSELGLVSGRVHEIKEKERKPTSCPMLFSWNGESFEFVADFLGVGGLGYFEAPGRYNTPDPTELLWIPRLQAKEGTDGEASYELRVLEPLEECTYLDSAALVAVDHPEGTRVLPNEMFAILGPAPGYGLLAFQEELHPLKAVDQDGADMTSRVQKLDAVYAPELKPDRRFLGTLEKLHALELDFPAALDELISSKEPGRPVLFLYGYIEYGYSTTNFAASQAGFAPLVPSFRVERDGKWETLRKEWGFPAGYPRWMSVDLGGLLRPGDRRLRIDTNLEIAWDEVFIAWARDVDLEGGGDAGVKVRQLKADRAQLHYRGFPVDPAPGEEVEGFLYKEFAEWTHYKAMPGSYTRFGDVRPLLEEDDGRFVVFGPGDEIEFSFKADRLGEPGPGSRRTFFWKSGGYCKDMDFYTGHGDGVAPLPFAGMKSYPYAEGESFPDDPALKRYQAEWNTRIIEGDLRTPISEVIGD